jgi:hypothetical protein
MSQVIYYQYCPTCFFNSDNIFKTGKYFLLAKAHLQLRNSQLQNPKNSVASKLQLI